MNPSDFQHEYDLTALQLIRPGGHSFEMEVTPRYLHHYVHNSYEPFTADLLANLLFSQRLFIDVGAHYGFYTLLAATRHSRLEVLALEPVQESYTVLTRNIERNGVKGVRALQRAASDCDGRALFNISLSSENCSFYPHPVAPPVYQIEVDTMTIDTLLRDHAPCPTVIKMDTDGHELKVLEGMKDTLARFRDLSLVVEFNPKMLKRAGHAPEDLLEKLERLGFMSSSLTTASAGRRSSPIHNPGKRLSIRRATSICTAHGGTGRWACASLPTRRGSAERSAAFSN